MQATHTYPSSFSFLHSSFVKYSDPGNQHSSGRPAIATPADLPVPVYCATDKTKQSKDTPHR